MPKSVRLINVDECVTSSGNVVKWADYYVPPNPYAADGHLASSHSLFVAGISGSGYNTGSEMVAFSSNSTASSHVAAYSVVNAASGSDSSQMMIGGGNTAINTVKMMQFSSGSTLDDHDQLTLARYGLTAGSNSDVVMFAGGHDSSVYSNYVDLKQFSSGSYSAHSGNIGTGKMVLAAASSGTEIIFSGGHTGSSWVKDMVKRKFGSDVNVYNHGQLLNQMLKHTAASNDTVMIVGSGKQGLAAYNSAACELVLFSSASTDSAWNSLSEPRYDLGASCDGNEVMFGSGNNYPHGYVGKVEKKSLTDKSILVSHGTMTAKSQYTAESGNP